MIKNKKITIAYKHSITFKYYNKIVLKLIKIKPVKQQLMSIKNK